MKFTKTSKIIQKALFWMKMDEIPIIELDNLSIFHPII